MKTKNNKTFKSKRNINILEESKAEQLTESLSIQKLINGMLLVVLGLIVAGFTSKFLSKIVGPTLYKRFYFEDVNSAAIFFGILFFISFFLTLVSFFMEDQFENTGKDQFYSSWRFLPFLRTPIWNVLLVTEVTIVVTLALTLYSPDAPDWSQKKLGTSFLSKLCPLPRGTKSGMPLVEKNLVPKLNVTAVARPESAGPQYTNPYQRMFNLPPAQTRDEFMNKYGLKPGSYSLTNQSIFFKESRLKPPVFKITKAEETVIPLRYFEVGWPMGIGPSYSGIPEKFKEDVPQFVAKNFKFKNSKQGYAVFHYGPSVETYNDFHMVLDFDETNWPKATLYIYRPALNKIPEIKWSLTNHSSSTDFGYASALILPVTYKVDGQTKQHPVLLWFFSNKGNGFQYYSASHWSAQIEFPSGAKMTAVLWDADRNGDYSTDGVFLDSNGDGSISSNKTEPPLYPGSNFEGEGYNLELLNISPLGDSVRVRITKI